METFASRTAAIFRITSLSLDENSVELISMYQRVPVILLEQATFLALELAELGERLGRSN